MKLAPGDPGLTAVVQRIFTMYAEEHASLSAVADRLNSDGIASSKQSRWTPSMVSYVLQNEAYNGTLLYRFRNKERPSDLLNLRDGASDRVIRCEGAHAAIVPHALWDAAQARLRTISHRKTDGMLLRDLQAYRARWQPEKNVPEEVVTGSDLRRGYGRPDVEIITTAKVEEASARVFKAVGEQMLVTPFEGSYLIDHLLHVGVLVSLPHARFGGLHWNFSFTGEEREDVILGFAFSPPPSVQHVETFFFRASHFRRRVRNVQPLLDIDARKQRYTRLGPEEVPISLLRYAIRFRGTRAEARLLEALRGRTKVSLRAIAEEIGWPVASARTLYRKLEIRGENLPALKNTRSRKRLTVICPHCLRSRSLAPAVVLSLRTDVCFECLHRPPVRTPNRLVVVCPDCGMRRLLTPSDVARRSGGLETPCRKCTLRRARLRRTP